jgi:23S rRNA pseudouridine2605 synthase
MAPDSHEAFLASIPPEQDFSGPDLPSRPEGGTRPLLRLPSGSAPATPSVAKTLDPDRRKPERPPRRERRTPEQETKARSGSGRKDAPGRPAGARAPRPASGSRGEEEVEVDRAPGTLKLHKVLADAGFGSRRLMEEIVSKGEVTVNGVRAQLGARVSPTDRIELRGQTIGGVGNASEPRAPRVLMYHKLEGEIVSRDDPEGRPSVFERVAPVRRGRWLTVGRLDFNTCGLLLFTDSGELANRLMHPRFGLEREYAVRILGELTHEQVEQLRRGITLEDGPARFDSIEAEGGEGSNRWYQVTVKEGRNRLVRRMFEALGYTVSRLMRTRFGPFALPPALRRGHWIELPPEDLGRMLAPLGVEVPAPVVTQGRPGRSERPGKPDRAARPGRAIGPSRSSSPPRSAPPRRSGGAGRTPFRRATPAAAGTPRRPPRKSPAR